MKTFRDRLLHLVEREHKRTGMSDSAFSRAAGLGKSYVSQVKRGKNETPAWETIEALARVGHADPHWLADGTGREPGPLTDTDLSPREQVIAMAQTLTPDLPDDVRKAAVEAFRVQPFKGNESIDALTAEFFACVRRAKDFKRGWLEEQKREQTDAEREAFD